MKIKYQIVAATCLLSLSGQSWSQNHGASVGMLPTPEDSDNVVRKPSYSPYAGRNFPTNVYFGDTHTHTDNSLDAKGFGAVIDVEGAYRLARGEEVVSNTGIPVKLSRPLDFLVVADHSDGMGAMKEIFKGNPNLLADPTVHKWNKQMNAGGDEAFQATMEVINAFSQGKISRGAPSRNGVFRP